MQRLVAASGAALLVALVFALSAPAGRGSSEVSMTIRVTSTIAGTRAVDVAPKGTSRGDRLHVKSILRNAVAQFGKKKGAVVGSDQAVFTLLTPTSASLTVVVKIPDGTLRVQGQVSPSTTSGRLRVVGGTGSFAGARGSCEVRDLPDHSLNVYRLTLP